MEFEGILVTFLRNWKSIEIAMYNMGMQMIELVVMEME
jgi:hypothetical protein